MIISTEKFNKVFEVTVQNLCYILANTGVIDVDKMETNNTYSEATTIMINTLAKNMALELLDVLEINTVMD